ncbi:hypothetical protein C923_01997 [Plasmodium falciparum UGT5.1]|uniref:Uncharacterized protein n=1 Tax=Plasmodium falciparum UGT5.1 TaxID=1237627 RepID=W7JEH7_PLAFA|nr:hypothetical protein C923_01997 [Plasmodium falciparum UGT5.1]
MYNIEIQNKLISHQVKKYKMQKVQIIKSNINYTNTLHIFLIKHSRVYAKIPKIKYSANKI